MLVIEPFFPTLLNAQSPSLALLPGSYGPKPIRQREWEGERERERKRGGGREDRERTLQTQERQNGETQAGRYSVRDIDK